jgi:hypothetical protein
MMGITMGDIFKHNGYYLIVQILGEGDCQTTCGKYVNGVYEGVIYTSLDKLYKMKFICNVNDLC